MKFKPNWPEARERFAALWHGELLGRPCLAATAPSGASVTAPAPPEDLEARWLDPDYLVGTALARMANAGWVVSLGGRPRFSESTIWFEPFPVDFGQPSPFVYAADDPWVVKHRAAYTALVEAAGRDDFLVGRPCLLPTFLETAVWREYYHGERLHPTHVPVWRFGGTDEVHLG